VLKKNDVALVTEFGNSDQMKGAIQQVLNNSGELEKIRENAFKFVQRFDRIVVLDNVLEKLEHL
jgi:hypothetical protein